MPPAHAPWPVGPGAPVASPLSLEVWRAELERQPPALADLLSADERERATRIVSARRRELWVGARAVLRELLGRYLGGDPRELQLVRGHEGKPALRESCRDQAQVPARQELSFNLAHRGGLAIYAIANFGPVGIDLEISGRERHDVAIAHRAFGAVTAAHLSRLDPQSRQQEFLRLWVRREAKLKCRGEGIWASTPERGSTLWVSDVAPAATGNEFVAVAAASAPARVCCWGFCSALGGG